MRIPFDNSYARLPERFYVRLAPTAVAAPKLVRVNRELAETLGIDPDALAGPAGVAALAGNTVPVGADAMALAYAGHQFGHFVPRLGDGRACLLGEVVGRDGLRRDIQLKGSGPTPFSRQGDGRAALGPVLREYIVSEAMAALGVPTTRTLAAVTSGEPVWREEMLPGAVLTRVARSHLRVGTFEYFAAAKDEDGVRLLADYAIARHYPRAAGSHRAFLDAVIAEQAGLVARWQLLGFIHGVMNTDNCSIAGETIDYGPCAFMEAYDPATVFSAIDRGGRYAYGNQPRIALWNLTRLAETLLPLLEGGVDEAKVALEAFTSRFQAASSEGWRRKIGLLARRPGDDALVEDLLAAMRAAGADFTLTFRRLCDAAVSAEGDDAVLALFQEREAIAAWTARWRARLNESGEPLEEIARAMRATNPAYIPRNHRVEQALAAASESADFGPFEALLKVVTRPFEDNVESAPYALPARDSERVLRTFCGT